MSASPGMQPTLREALPWVKMMLDYTDSLAALIPEDLIDWRPEDPSGAFFFSLGEIVMHCADARLMFARQLSGDDSAEGYWSDGPSADGETWEFRPHDGKQSILDSLASARREIEPFLDRSASLMGEVTDGARAAFDKHIAWLREKGKEKEIADMNRRGPANIVRVLMALACHESGHRGTLQTLLRLRGINYSS